jgi:hypothetical protein
VMTCRRLVLFKTRIPGSAAGTVRPCGGEEWARNPARSSRNAESTRLRIWEQACPDQTALCQEKAALYPSRSQLATGAAVRARPAPASGRGLAGAPGRVLPWGSAWEVSGGFSAGSGSSSGAHGARVRDAGGGAWGHTLVRQYHAATDSAEGTGRFCRSAAAPPATTVHAACASALREGNAAGSSG